MVRFQVRGRAGGSGAISVIVLAACTVLGLCGPAAAAARPTLFRVGAAVRSIDPPVPVYAGGFSLSPAIQKVHDPLKVRAIYISNGHTAIGFATIDAQGYFAAYDEGTDLGATADRVDAAEAASAAGGVPMSSADIIEQATHTHAGPTLEGIWGPVPVPYLELVHRQVVSAIAGAAKAARPAHLQFATIDDNNIASVNVNQDDPQGFINDPQLSVLRAVSPTSGATIATYANVPTHGAQVCGQCLGTLSADYFGAVRAALDARLGGISVVGPATLGREESPVETTGFTNMDWLSGVITNDVLQALGHAAWITASELAAQQEFITFPAINALLLALNSMWSLPDAQKEQIAKLTGDYPIDRAERVPYRVANVFGTYLTAIRVGDVAYASMPGEPWPEVRFTIARAVPSATVVALSKGQDDFGYFYPAYDYALPELYNSDNTIFNVGPQVGDLVIHDQVAQLGRLGFDAGQALETPLPNNYLEKLRPGLQTLASPPTGDAGPNDRFTTRLQAIYMPASILDRPLAGQVHWNFGDGSQQSTGFLSVGQDFLQTGQGDHGQAIFTHSFRPGVYRVTASGKDTIGAPVSWTITVRVFAELRVTASCRDGRPRAVVTGGEGTLLRESWSRRGRHERVRVLDAAGGTATATARCA
jgi:hypothetical protein